MHLVGFFVYAFFMKTDFKLLIKNKKSLFIDIGASSIKIKQLGLNITTPSQATPSKLLAVLKELSIPANYNIILVGFPGIVTNGITVNAPNMNTKSWKRFPLEKKLNKIFSRPCFVMNDADLHGFKVISGKGTELVISLGTGVGSALFINNKLVPNLEMGHAPFKNNKSFEDILGLASFKKSNLKHWEKYLLEALVIWENLFSPTKIYLTGGLSNIIKSPAIVKKYKLMGNP
jgi:polyphosphate glucokinase